MLSGCEDCQTSYVSDCLKHCLQPVADKVILSRAWASLPVVLQIFRLSDSDSAQSAGQHFGLMNTHTHTHPFNGPFSRTTQVSRFQNGKTYLDFTEARDSEWQRHQLGHMQVCTSLQTDDHASTHRSVFTGRMPFLPPNQQCQSTDEN